VTEHPAAVAENVACILDVPIPGEHQAIAELHRIRSATRRVIEAGLIAKVSRGVRRPNDGIKRAVEELLEVPWRSVSPEEADG
jgi:hypothetical protein